MAVKSPSNSQPCPLQRCYFSCTVNSYRTGRIPRPRIVVTQSNALLPPTRAPQVAVQNAVDSVPSLSRLALAGAGGAGGGGGGRPSEGGAASAATAGPNATFTIRTPFGVDADRGDGVLGWLSLEGSGGSRAPTTPAGGSRPATFTAKGKGRPGENVGPGEAVGSNVSAPLGVLPPPRAGAAPDKSMWLGDRTAQAPVVLLRRPSADTGTLGASALVTPGGLELFPPSVEGIGGTAAAREGPDRGRPRNRASGGKGGPEILGCRRDDRYTAAAPTPFVSAGQEMRAWEQKRTGSGPAVASDGSLGEATPAAVEAEEVRLSGLARSFVCLFAMPMILMDALSSFWGWRAGHVAGYFDAAAGVSPYVWTTLTFPQV